MSTNDSRTGFSAVLPEGANYIATNVYLSNGPNEISMVAKWDTGAYMSCIPAKAVKELLLEPKGIETTRGTFGEEEISNTYHINLTITGGYTFRDLRVIGLSDDNPTEYMLIGMDVISQGDFLFSGHGGGVFSFRVPSTETVSFKL